MPKKGAHVIERRRVHASNGEEAKDKVRPEFPPPRYILRSHFIGGDVWEVEVFDTQ
ncbi:MAG: hypothetical protein WAW39_11045 [Prosthecobacter sp.]|uniref:hypothetical protein n=1 Tax=Prosthecobacter sp. TaxID=1965333 RepID=UPI003BAFC837